MKKFILICLLAISPFQFARAEFAAQGEMVADYGAWILAQYILRGDLVHDNRPMAIQTSGSCPCNIFLGSWGSYADGGYGSGSSHTVNFDTQTVGLTERSTWEEKPVTFSEVARALDKGGILNKQIPGNWEFYPRRPGVGFCFNLGIHYTGHMQREQTADNPIILCSPLDPAITNCDIEGPDYIDHGTLSNSSMNGHTVNENFTISCTSPTDVKISAVAGLDNDNFIFMADGLESEIKVNGDPSTVLSVDSFVKQTFNVTSTLRKTKDLVPDEYSGIFLLSVELP
ncbi:hypothetical protein LDO51_02800 [Providencia alcalifaciens]|uniref:MrpH family fimbial adhesin n=1 Tax=Providencia alcalifaciens TaxID=126385 RepID=UPI001CE19FC4|nr:hypothetical protein [Providencia alcalifaciens]UBX49765.1 hypothetical protein LDO51_02800 [Providencia alcalifaciens]